MPAVDAKQYNLSHFDNSDIWFKASNDQNVKTGWLGRWIDRNGNDTNPLQAISIDTALSKAIRTQNNPVCAIPSLPIAASPTAPAASAASNSLNLNTTMRDLAGLGAGRRQRVPRALALDLRPRGRDLAALSASTSATPTPTATPLRRRSPIRAARSARA